MRRLSCARFAATRMIALRARGLAATSAADGRMRPSASSRIGCGCGKRRAAIVHLARMAAMNCLTMRSSSEWKLITTSRPMGCKTSRAGPQRLLQLFKLGVDENPKSLKCARCRVLARLAGFDRVSHELGQLGGG
jgi:hypothetical protein